NTPTLEMLAVYTRPNGENQDRRDRYRGQGDPLTDDVRDSGYQYATGSGSSPVIACSWLSLPAAFWQCSRQAGPDSAQVSGCHFCSWMLLASPQRLSPNNDRGHWSGYLDREVRDQHPTRPHG